MDMYKETFDTWDKIALQYQNKFMDLDIYNFTYDFFLDLVPNDNAKILEIGCGPGNITRYLLKKRPDLNIFGIDISPNMVRLAKKNNPKASFTKMDIRQINLLKDKYDAIICGFCLPYLSPDDSFKLIADCSGLIFENGALYFSFEEGDPKKSDFQLSNSGDRMFFYFHQLEKLTEQLSDNGFEVIKVFKVEYETLGNPPNIHTILTAKKRMTAKNFGKQT